MQFNIKKPSVTIKMEKATPIDVVYSTINKDGILIHCPQCKGVHVYHEEWPIDIPILCNLSLVKGTCSCRFIIKNDTPIED